MERWHDPAWIFGVGIFTALASGFAFYGWLVWHPWQRATCADPVWTALTWVPFLVFPPAFVGVRARLAGKDWASLIFLVVAVALMTAVSCFLAFFGSFTHLHCGE